MNKIQKIADILDLHIGEIFEDETGTEYKLTIEDGLREFDYDEDRWKVSDNLQSFLLGDLLMRKAPYKPKLGETYFYFKDNIKEPITASANWYATISDYQCLLVGNCFRSWEEARKYKDELIKKLKEQGNE